MDYNPYQAPNSELLTPLPAETVKLKHSGLGIASLILAIASIVLAVCSFGTAAFLAHKDPAMNVEDNQVGLFLIGIAIIASFFAALAGIGLGIGGLCQSQRNRLFAGIGLGINGTILLGVACLMVIGIAAS